MTIRHLRVGEYPSQGSVSENGWRCFSWGQPSQVYQHAQTAISHARRQLHLWAHGSNRRSPLGRTCAHI